jgi:hypothetical protein
MIEEGGMSMEIKSKTGASQVYINWVHLFLVVLHFVVFVITVLSQDFITQVAARALPQTL